MGPALGSVLTPQAERAGDRPAAPSLQPGDATSGHQPLVVEMCIWRGARLPWSGGNMETAGRRKSRNISGQSQGRTPRVGTERQGYEPGQPGPHWLSDAWPGPSE